MQLMIPSQYDRVKITNVFDMTANELLLPIAECHWFDLSPDGRHIMFYRYMETRGRCEPHLIDVDGNNLQNLPFNAYTYWSPDSRQLLIADQQSIFLIDIENIDDKQTLFPNPAYLGIVWGALQWSTDNTQIIFVDEQAFDIYTLRIHPDIGSPTRLNLTTQRNMTPIWSPNDEEIAFISDMSDWEIYIANVDGTYLRRVTFNDEIEVGLVWLP
jgi:Tol biopolymer transport system component